MRKVDYYDLVVRSKKNVQKLPFIQVKQSIDSLLSTQSGISYQSSNNEMTLEGLSPLLQDIFSKYRTITIASGVELSQDVVRDLPDNDSFLEIGTEPDGILVCIRKSEEPIYVIEDLEDLSEVDMPTVYHWLFYRYLLHSRQLEAVL